jgi:hypothetical protein
MYHTKRQLRGCKLLKIEGAPKLGIFELRNGKYWDGIPATLNGTATPMPDGFYVCELTRDGFIATKDDGSNTVHGPYASAKEAERKTRKALAKLEKVGAELEREGKLRREVGEDGVVRYQAVVPYH